MAVSPVDPSPDFTRRIDPEEAQLALHKLQQVLKHYDQLSEQARRFDDDTPEADRALRTLTQQRHQQEISTIINALHAADIAFILESLPEDERQLVWGQVNDTH